jgi:serine/threonine protein kinase
MYTDVVENWFRSCQYAIVGHVSAKPMEHSLSKKTPLVIEKGQAAGYFLVDDKGNRWILKKFHGANELDRDYLQMVSSLLPKHDGFFCGIQRWVLSRGVLRRASGYYYSKDLDHWLDGTILMPKVAGFDWASLADELRDGSSKLDEQRRFTLCRNLARLVEVLEAARCAHRDLSSGNVFVDPTGWRVCLIDFDSLYHPSLRMPRATTCGTVGYSAPYAWNNGRMDPTRTWREHADRYALSLINTEFLLVSPGTKLTGDGGIFDQDELKKRSGPGIDSIVSQLRASYPRAAKLLEATIHSSSFSDCPSPQDWDSVCNGKPSVVFKPPSLSDMPKIPTNLIGERRPAAPLWPAPRLIEMPPATLWLPERSKIVIPGPGLSILIAGQRRLSPRPL